MILEQLELLKQKKISSLELVEIYEKRARADEHNAWITLEDPEHLRGQAQRADEKRQKNHDDQEALLGIPLAIKDNIITQGLKTTCASRILENYVPPYDAAVIQALKGAGALVLGKTNMDEFGMGGSNENSCRGPVKNPLDPKLVPGGSSGGSAAVLRAQQCSASLGSDTGGSIRLPASYTGIVGLKPTYGRVSRFGLVAFASSLEQIGPMTWSVDDAELMLDVMSRKVDYDFDSTHILDSVDTHYNRSSQSSAIDPKTLRVGLPEEYFGEGLSQDVRSQVEALVKGLEKQGVKTVPVSLPHTKYSVAVYYIVAVCEASSNLARFDGVRFGPRLGEGSRLDDLYRETRSLFGPEVKRRILLGTFALSAGYYDAYYKKAAQVRRLLQRDFQEAFKSCDVILGPVAPTTAFSLGAKTKDPLQMYLNDILTIPVNLAGLPALSLPCGRSSADLPVGAQIIAPHWQEARLFQLGRLIEKCIYKENPPHGI